MDRQWSPGGKVLLLAAEKAQGKYFQRSSETFCLSQLSLFVLTIGQRFLFAKAGHDGGWQWQCDLIYLLVLYFVTDSKMTLSLRFSPPRLSLQPPRDFLLPWFWLGWQGIAFCMCSCGWPYINRAGASFFLPFPAVSRFGWWWLVRGHWKCFHGGTLISCCLSIILKVGKRGSSALKAQGFCGNEPSLSSAQDFETNKNHPHSLSFPRWYRAEPTRKSEQENSWAVWMLRSSFTGQFALSQEDTEQGLEPAALFKWSVEPEHTHIVYEQDSGCVDELTHIQQCGVHLVARDGWISHLAHSRNWIQGAMYPSWHWYRGGKMGAWSGESGSRKPKAPTWGSVSSSSARSHEHGSFFCIQTPCGSCLRLICHWFFFFSICLSFFPFHVEITFVIITPL